MKTSKKLYKQITPPLERLNELFDDEYFTGLMICFLTDAVGKYAEDQDRNMRQIAITFNKTFTYEYDLTTGEYHCNDKGELEK